MYITKDGIRFNMDCSLYAIVNDAETVAMLNDSTLYVQGFFNNTTFKKELIHLNQLKTNHLSLIINLKTGQIETYNFWEKP